MTKSHVAATLNINTHGYKEASTSAMPPREDEVDIPQPIGYIEDDIEFMYLLYVSVYISYI